MKEAPKERKRGLLYILVVNFLVLIGVIFLAEFSSYGVLQFYYGSLFSAQDQTTGEKLQLSNSYKVYSSETLYEDWLDWTQKGGYHFRPYVMYVNKPFESKYFNILDDYRRSNGIKTEVTRKDCGLTIGMYGSSSLTAPEVHDNETLTAVLERLLNDPESRFGLHNGRKICVNNYGIVGSWTPQDLNFFNLNTIQYGAPDIVITFNGWNDFLGLTNWEYKPVNVRHYDWFDRIFDQNIINETLILSWFRGLFPNFLQLSEKAIQFVGWKLTENAVFVQNYKKRAKIFNENIRRNFPERSKFILKNLSGFSGLCKINQCEVVYTQIPNLLASDKTKSSYENYYFNGRGLIHSDRSAELRQDGPVDRFAYKQLMSGMAMVNRDEYGKMYKLMNIMTKEMAHKLGAGYLDFQNLLNSDEYDNMTLYVSYSHLSREALSILAEGLASYLVENNYLD